MDHLKKQISKWDCLLIKVYGALTESSAEGKSYSKDDIREYTAFTIKYSQFFTFDSIKTLFKNGLYFQSFSLLRSLFESQITLWRICNSNIDTAMEFIRRAEKASYNMSVEINIMFKEEYNDYYDKNCLTPIDIERGYWDKPLTEIIDMIDKIEEDSWPYHGLMYLRLYSAGSEYLHPSSFSIDESIFIKELANGSQTPIINAKLGFEAAWWSIIIIIDSEKWYRALLGDKYKSEFEDLKRQAMNLTSEWAKRV